MRILVAIGRNIKATFTKKQDSKAVLAELVSDLSSVGKKVKKKQPSQIKIIQVQSQPAIKSKPTTEVKAESKINEVETTIEPTEQETETKPKPKTDEIKNTEISNEATEENKTKNLLNASFWFFLVC